MDDSLSSAAEKNENRTTAETSFVTDGFSTNLPLLSFLDPSPAHPGLHTQDLSIFVHHSNVEKPSTLTKAHPMLLQVCVRQTAEPQPPS